MLRHVALAAIAAAFVSAPAVAQDSAPAAAPKPADKKICKRIVPTGSIMAKMTCMTRAEWKALASKSADDVERRRDSERVGRIQVE